MPHRPVPGTWRLCRAPRDRAHANSPHRTRRACGARPAMHSWRSSSEFHLERRRAESVPVGMQASALAEGYWRYDPRAGTQNALLAPRASRSRSCTTVPPGARPSGTETSSSASGRNDRHDPQRTRLDDHDLVAHDDVVVAAILRDDLHHGLGKPHDVDGSRNRRADAEREIDVVYPRRAVADDSLADLGALLAGELNRTAASASTLGATARPATSTFLLGALLPLGSLPTFLLGTFLPTLRSTSFRTFALLLLLGVPLSLRGAT